MKRIREIIANIRHRYPNDDFFLNFEHSCRISQGKRNCYRAYNSALMVLDDDSWLILKSKALRHYFDHRNGQKKQGFFNQLNEAFAYRYLVTNGFDNVRFIKESKEKSPDIKFTGHDGQSYCEVKTLGISNDEINRRHITTVCDGSIHGNLSDEFLKKFCDAVNTAKRQICAFGPNGLVYVIIKFDDIALDYYKNYRKQLTTFSDIHGFDDLFVKIGLLGNNEDMHN